MRTATALEEPPASSLPAKLTIRNLTVTRRNAAGVAVTAVDDVSFEVGSGEFVCLLGPSGCGKTSVLNAVAGLERPASGQVLVDGRPIDGPGPDRAVLFQEPALFPWLSVLANVEFALRLAGSDATERSDRAMRWLSTVGLANWASSQPHELSAGMRQRAALARALACEPPVLLADEPFGSLDAQARELLQEQLNDAWSAERDRMTVLFVTHNVREAAILADRVLVMTAAPGRLLEEQRLSAPRPRNLEDPLVSRVVADIHESLREEVDKGVAREMGG